MASDVYNNKIVSEKSYMQAASTRVVTFEMCGNDGLQARTSFKDQTGTCNYGVLNTALANCKTYVASATNYINANASPNVKLKVIANLSSDQRGLFMRANSRVCLLYTSPKPQTPNPNLPPPPYYRHCPSQPLLIKIVSGL